MAALRYSGWSLPSPYRQSSRHRAESQGSPSRPILSQPDSADPYGGHGEAAPGRGDALQLTILHDAVIPVASSSTPDPMELQPTVPGFSCASGKTPFVSYSSASLSIQTGCAFSPISEMEYDGH